MKLLISLPILILALGSIQYACSKHTRAIDSQSICSDSKVDSAFYFHFNEYNEILKKKNDFRKLSKNGLLFTYLLSPGNINGKVSYSYGGVQFDVLAVKEWEGWYRKNRCSISWEDLEFGIRLYSSNNENLDLEQGMKKIDSLFSH